MSNKNFNTEISAKVTGKTLCSIYGILDNEEIPYSAYVRKADKGVRLITIYADAKDIQHFKNVLNKYNHD